MIPIYSIEDIKIVKDEILKEGLLKEFDRLPDDYEYPDFGYFIVIESIEELKHPIPLKYCDLEFTPENLEECIEMVEEFEGYSQIVCVLYTDFGVSLFVSDEVTNNFQLEIFFEI